MKNIFNSVKMIKPKNNVFDLSHDIKFSMDMGRLVPHCILEVVPGDNITQSCEQMIRFAPMTSPAMHRINAYTHFFFVPNRILWDGWEEFITGGDGEEVTPVAPYLYINNAPAGSIADYLGVPTDAGTNLKVSALPFAAYYKVFDEFYRDQNLSDPVGFPLDDGNNTTLFATTSPNAAPFHRAWEHDYFTSALPWPQKGAEVTMPLGTDADLVYDSNMGQTKITQADGSTPPFVAGNWELKTNSDGYIHFGTDGIPTAYNVDTTENTYVDLSTATAASINDLRRAFKVQEWLEKNARGGTRYIEHILSHFGVRSSDARLQRPEYLGGGKSPVIISEVLQTSGSVAGATPQGNLSGHGISVGSSHAFHKTVEEHGYIIGIMSVMPEPAYSQGLNRHWFRFNKLDYYWPSFANIGEQEVLNKELFANTSSEDEEVFGYVPRYAEYKYMSSRIAGDFRETLEYWHLGRKFTEHPNLNQDFINCVPSKRIFAVQDLPDTTEGSGEAVVNFHNLYCHVFHRIRAVRPMPVFGVPQI